LNCVGYVASNGFTTVNDTLQVMSKEVVVVYYFKAPSRNLPRGSEKNHITMPSDNICL